MQLIGNLKKQVEQANSMTEAKEMIKSAGMMLTDDELEMVSGGGVLGVRAKPTSGVLSEDDQGIPTDSFGTINNV